MNNNNIEETKINYQQEDEELAVLAMNLDWLTIRNAEEYDWNHPPQMHMN